MALRNALVLALEGAESVDHESHSQLLIIDNQEEYACPLCDFKFSAYTDTKASFDTSNCDFRQLFGRPC